MLHAILLAMLLLPLWPAKAETPSPPLPQVRFIPARPDIGQLPNTLQFCGAGKLTSDSPIFGGVSGIALTVEGSRYILVSDDGYYGIGTLVLDGNMLTDITLEAYAPLVSRSQRSTTRKKMIDAESVIIRKDGSIWVSFERKHRVWEYRLNGSELTFSQPAATPPIPAINILYGNKAFEALAQLKDGRTLLLAEKLPFEDKQPGFTQMLVSNGDHWHVIRYPLEGTFYPTDMAVLPNGDVMILERSHSFAGLRSRLMRLDQTMLSAEQVAPVLVADTTDVMSGDNAEGLALQTLDDGRVMFILVTDDNFRLWQHTYVTALCYDYRTDEADGVAKTPTG